jgi:hypothetical protein
MSHLNSIEDKLERGIVASIEYTKEGFDTIVRVEITGRLAEVSVIKVDDDDYEHIVALSDCMYLDTMLSGDWCMHADGDATLAVDMPFSEYDHVDVDEDGAM